MQAVIFDFDGLIADTETPEVRSWEQVFARYGAAYPPEYWQYILGRGAEQERESPADLLRAQGATFDEAAVLAERESVLRDMLASLRPLPGVIERLGEAKALGLKLGVASSSRHDWVDGFLSRLGLIHYFDQIVCLGDAERGKPFPDLYTECCRRLGVSPAEAVALEDSPNGVAAARAAGVYVIAVPNPISAHLDLSAADRIVRSLEEVSLADLL